MLNGGLKTTEPQKNVIHLDELDTGFAEAVAKAGGDLSQKN